MNKLSDRDKYISNYISRKQLKGTAWIQLGALVLLVYSAYKFFLRYDSVDEVLKAYFLLANRAEDYGMPFAESVKILWDVARGDLLALVYLGVSALFSAWAVLTHNSVRAAVPAMALSFIAAIYNESGNWFFAIMDWLSTVKLGACVVIFLGSALKLGDYVYRKQIAAAKYRRKLQAMKHKKAMLPHGDNRTLIPERIR